MLTLLKANFSTTDSKFLQFFLSVRIRNFLGNLLKSKIFFGLKSEILRNALKSEFF